MEAGKQIACSPRTRSLMSDDEEHDCIIAIATKTIIEVCSPAVNSGFGNGGSLINFASVGGGD
jgi:hypothetical protein